MSRMQAVASGAALVTAAVWVLTWFVRDGSRRLDKAVLEAGDPGLDILSAEPMTGMTIDEAAALGAALVEHAATAIAEPMADVHKVPGVGPDREWCHLTPEQEDTFAAIAAGCPDLDGAE
jgi:hypothetical protein